MEQQIFLACVLTPAIISLAFVVLSIKTRESLSAPVAVCGWCLAVAVPLFVRQSQRWMPDHVWPQDAWQQVLGPIAIGSLAMSLVAWQSARLAEARWVVAGLALTFVGIIAMPSGDGWADMMQLHRFWMGAMIASGLVNLWLLDRMTRRGAEGWVLWVALAGLGCPVILAASAFGGLAEWVVAAIVATLVMACAASWQLGTAIGSVIYPVVLFSVSAIASGRFYTYEDHPVWLYGVMLLVPSVIALVDVPLQRRSTRTRVVVALITSLLLLSCVAWFILGSSLILGAPAEEQW